APLPVGPSVNTPAVPPSFEPHMQSPEPFLLNTEPTPQRGTETPSRRRQGRLRTYVTPTTSSVRAETLDVTEGRTETDVAGISFALEYERSQDRFPTPMPHHHEGFDIESRDADDTVVRYIEVKSISGEWGTLGVGLSKPQFDKAAGLRERYWLYVVERAGQADARLYRINNPAHRVDQF